MTAPVLWHIEISHFNEKARWALDLKGVEHERRAPLPGVLHPFQAFRLTRQWHFPVLELDGRAIADSTRIIEALERRYPDPPLYPDDPADRARALELEDYFDEQVAPDVRRLGFWLLSGDRELAGDGMKLIGAPGGDTRVARAVAPRMVRLTARRYGGSEARIAEAQGRIRAGVERIEAEIGPSGYLVGDRFSVADLTAASIFMPIVDPPEFQYELPEFPPAFQEFRRSLPERGLEWVREMWRRHRPPALHFGK